MESYLYHTHHDLITPDGIITQISKKNHLSLELLVRIEGISPRFVGFQIDPHLVSFNLKSSLAQIGMDATGMEYSFHPASGIAEVRVNCLAVSEIGQEMLALLEPGIKLGKLFAADDRRRVRDPTYLQRLFGREDLLNRPLLALGSTQGSRDLILEIVEGRVVAFLTLKEGTVSYAPTIHGYLPTMVKALHSGLPTREFVGLHQQFNAKGKRTLQPGQMLLVKTLPLHIRTVFAKVVDELLPKGFHHTSANVLQPDTFASGDIYEFYGQSSLEIRDVPLEFYTLEPHREYVSFCDRDQLQSVLENEELLFKTFETAPPPSDHLAATYIVKGSQLLNLQASDWISREYKSWDWVSMTQNERLSWLIQKHIEHQPEYPFLKAMDDDLITSQGLLFTRYFPTPPLKRMLLSDHVHHRLKGLYFLYPSPSEDSFSYSARSLIVDLTKFGIPVFWLDTSTKKILQYVHREDKDSGMFLPLNRIETFLKGTLFGVYGSNLVKDDSESEFLKLFEGLLKMQKSTAHPLLNPTTPLVLVTGGGPGAMETANKVAQKLGILSCAYIIDFHPSKDAVINEQRQNSYIEGKIIYRVNQLVERQGEFHLDFPIFVTGGIGTDFELALESVCRKVGSTPSTPILLFGSEEYWSKKLSSCFQCNLQHGTIAGSEWVSNNFYCVQTAAQALAIYQLFFSNQLPIGKEGPTYASGFATPETLAQVLKR